MKPILFAFAAFLLLFLFTTAVKAQKIVDQCFTTLPYGTAQDRSNDLRKLSGDLLEWDGSKWLGQWPKAQVTLAPPKQDYCNNPVRAIWLGNGTSWNQFGEGVSLRLDQPLKAGNTYTFEFIYASDGAGSDGRFAPEISTSFLGEGPGDVVARLVPAGNAWRTEQVTFTADHRQHGNTWLVIHTNTTGTSGLIFAQCPQEKFTIRTDDNPCNGKTIGLVSSYPLSNYHWSDSSSDKRMEITQTGTYYLTSSSPCGTYTDTTYIEFTDCDNGIGVPKPKAKGKGIKIRINWCKLGFCDPEDNEEPTGPPSPEIEVYNVVTPDGDGYNDVFYLTGAEIGVWKVRVFNRWGMLVYTSNYYLNDWSPSELSAGSYYYVVKDYNSDNYHRGTLTIIRR